jgi:hypothetical protein
MKKFTFEISLLTSVSEEAETAEEAMQKIAEHFDGHIVTMEIAATLDSSTPPVLFEINDQACERRDMT